MSKHTQDHQNHAQLRKRALSRLTSTRLHDLTRASASEALGVLHQLASSPETAADALALLHELQVHQVELEVQEEELRKSRTEIESRLGRHAQLYDFSPAACFAIGLDKTISDLNLAGARLLGYASGEVLGKSLADYLEPQSTQSLSALLMSVPAEGRVDAVSLQFIAAGGALKAVRAAMCADPAGSGALLAVVDTS